MAQIARIENHSILPTSIDEPLRLLVLEDSEFDAHRMRRVLNAVDPNFDVSLCGSVAEFNELAKSGRFDVAIVDYLLPDGDGLEALRKLQSDENFEAPAAIMVTGEGDETVAASAIGSGYSAYITKAGLNAETMRAVLDKALSQHDQQSMSDVQNLLNDAIRQSLGEASDIAVAPARQMMLRMLRASRVLKRLAMVRHDDVLTESVFEVEFTCMNALNSLFEFNGYRERFRRSN